MRTLLQANLDSGADLGASVSVVLHVETVVDLWGGWADHERTKPWQADTLVNVWSTTKPMMAISALVLVDRGELDPYQKVAHVYWPEFAANGKENVTVAQAMSHQAGLHAAPPADVILNWYRAIDYIANGTPAWPRDSGTARSMLKRISRARSAKSRTV